MTALKQQNCYVLVACCDAHHQVDTMFSALVLPAAFGMLQQQGITHFTMQSETLCALDGI